MDKFEDKMDQLVNQLVKDAEVDTATRHSVLKLDESLLPEGVTEETIRVNVDALNMLTVASGEANAQITRQINTDNESILNMDSTLDLGSVVINSNHYLKQDVDDETVYGISYTTVDHQFGSALSTYHDDCVKSNIEQASKLFS